MGRPGLLLLQGDSRRVSSWVGRGTVPSYVVPADGWTAVVPAGESAAQAPYDDGLTMLAGRPVPHGFRVSIGFFAIDRRAVVVAHRRGWRTIPRWLIWQPSKGAARVPGLAPLRVDDLLEVASLTSSTAERVRSLLRTDDGTPVDFLRDLVEALALPAGHLLSGSGAPPDAELITPTERDVARFDRIVSEEKQIRQEQEELR